MVVAALRESFHSLPFALTMRGDKRQISPSLESFGTSGQKLKIQTKRLIPSLQPHGATNQCWSYCRIAVVLLVRPPLTLIPIG